MYNSQKFIHTHLKVMNLIIPCQSTCKTIYRLNSQRLRISFAITSTNLDVISAVQKENIVTKITCFFFQTELNSLANICSEASSTHKRLKSGKCKLIL